jgi:hypothetical protein
MTLVENARLPRWVGHDDPEGQHRGELARSRIVQDN